MAEWCRKDGTALVTGGSSGVGFAIARELLQCGMDVSIVARGETQLADAKDSLASDGKVTTISADISSPAGIDAIVAATADLSSIDVVVNCAGVVTPALLIDQTDEQLSSQIETNLLGTIRVTRALLPKVPSGGAIINISSAMSFFGLAGYSAYCASKYGIVGFSEVMRRELLARGISVHVVCLNDVDTPQYEKEHMEMPEWMKDEGARGKIMTAEVAARRTLKAVRAGKFFITPDLTMTLLDSLLRHFPKFGRWLFDRALPRPR